MAIQNGRKSQQLDQPRDQNQKIIRDNYSSFDGIRSAGAGEYAYPEQQIRTISERLHETSARSSGRPSSNEKTDRTDANKNPDAKYYN